VKILQNEITETQTSFDTNFGGKLSFIPSILFPEGLHCCHTTYIFTDPTWSTTIITLEPCAFNLWAPSRTDVVNLYIRFSTLRDTIEIGDRRWKQAQREGEREGNFMVNSTVKNSTCFLCWNLATWLVDTKKQSSVTHHRKGFSLLPESHVPVAQSKGILSGHPWDADSKLIAPSATHHWKWCKTVHEFGLLMRPS